MRKSSWKENTEYFMIYAPSDEGIPDGSIQIKPSIFLIPESTDNRVMVRLQHLNAPLPMYDKFYTFGMFITTETRNFKLSMQCIVDFYKGGFDVGFLLNFANKISDFGYALGTMTYDEIINCNDRPDQFVLEWLIKYRTCDIDIRAYTHIAKYPNLNKFLMDKLVSTNDVGKLNIISKWKEINRHSGIRHINWQNFL